MKNKKNKQQEVRYEIVTPLPGVKAGEDGLFDDCPLCQDLKKAVEMGMAAPAMEASWEELEDDDELKYGRWRRWN